MNIHPILVGVINAIIPGTGYVILRERVVFGSFLLAGSIAVIILSFIEPVFLPASFFVSTTVLGKILESFWYVFFVLAYGYDAYDLAMKKRAAHLPAVISEING